MPPLRMSALPSPPMMSLPAPPRRMLAASLPMIVSSAADPVTSLKLVTLRKALALPESRKTLTGPSP